MQWEVVKDDYELGDIVEFNDCGQMLEGEIMAFSRPPDDPMRATYSIYDNDDVVHYVMAKDMLRKVGWKHRYGEV